MTVDPKIIDREIADLSIERAKQENRLFAELEQLHRIVGDRKRYVGRQQVWGMDDIEVLERAEAGIGVAPYEARQVADLLVLRTDRQTAIATLSGRIRELQDIYRAHRWSRFFLVQDGHIHSSQACHTCRVTTEMGWLPDLSGETEEQAVAAHGALLCTVCFPSAPVEWTNHYEKLEEAKKAARCAGSGRMYNPNKERELRQMSKWGYCQECDTIQTVTPNGNIRAHKPPVK